MRDLDRLLAERFNRRGFMRLAGASGVGAALLAACRRAEEAGPRATGGERPSIEEEPGNLQIFDWSGYGNGDYYPREEKQFLWSQYQRETGDTPEFILLRTTAPVLPRPSRGRRSTSSTPMATATGIGSTPGWCSRSIRR
jgi:hypothetical protein